MVEQLEDMNWHIKEKDVCGWLKQRRRYKKNRKLIFGGPARSRMILQNHFGVKMMVELPESKVTENRIFSVCIFGSLWLHFDYEFNHPGKYF
jgi:hypothetical protein